VKSGQSGDNEAKGSYWLLRNSFLASIPDAQIPGGQWAYL
jgi:hypothetical protein